MAQDDPTPSYVDLSTQAYTLFVDAFASANKRALDYAKSLYEIASRPYASTAIETAARENFDRSNQIIALTVDHMQTSGQKSSEFAQKLLAQGAKVQDSYVAAMRGIVNTGVSNLNFVKETADQQVDAMVKRVDDMQNRAAAAVSKN